MYHSERARLNTHLLGIRVTVETVVTVEPADPFAPLWEPQTTSRVISTQTGEDATAGATIFSAMSTDTPQSNGTGTRQSIEQGEDALIVTDTVTIDRAQLPAVQAVQDEDRDGIANTIASSVAVEFPGVKDSKTGAKGEAEDRGAETTVEEAGSLQASDVDDTLNPASKEKDKEAIAPVVTTIAVVNDVNKDANSQEVGTAVDRSAVKATDAKAQDDAIEDEGAPGEQREDDAVEGSVKEE
ncbi:hypothetical protein CALVIDRAFT_598693 [Calocera viscosa TUFC12733]|uniref:Uncharacterized protein n=1 Tax=Calocera viscosa (strain TUFC12733) TaxID=1330018 RepID=A0A167LSW9_CALVF|nr:hypothetical protein CALVIDRAFT_598693 [Calocera viscosa TUFC12733]